jgi:reductive dehalogenase
MHDDVKRREFLVACAGLGGLTAGGIASSAAHQASVLVESVASSRPWWTETADEPVLDIDEEVYSRFNQHKNVLNAYRDYVSEERAQEVEDKKEAMRVNVEAGTMPGYRREDNALMLAGWTLRGTGNMNRGLRSWTNTGRRRGPITQWETTPDHAANVVKRAAWFFGAGDVGIAPLDRRHIFSRSYGVDIHFEDVDEPYEIENEKAVIPEKVQYAIAIVMRMSPDVAALAPSQLCDATTSLGYSRLEFTVGHLGAFIRNLGYTAIPSVNGLGSSPPFAVDAGLGEMGRTNRFISPIFGPAVQVGKVLTDLPLTVDKPINFGLKEFCKACGRCAETCPSQALSYDEEPSFTVRGEWNNPGHQSWYEDSVRCFEFWEESNSYCSTCIMVCPWAKKDKTVLHEIVKASSANMPFLDRFLASMDESFGYGRMKDPDAWWHLDLNEHGIESW